jgi:hypothetical protein
MGWFQSHCIANTPKPSFPCISRLPWVSGDRLQTKQRPLPGSRPASPEPHAAEPPCGAADGDDHHSRFQQRHAAGRRLGRRTTQQHQQHQQQMQKKRQQQEQERLIGACALRTPDRLWLPDGAPVLAWRRGPWRYRR